MSISRPRWLSVILMLMFCISLMFAGGTAAAPKTVTKAPTVATNTEGSCVDNGYYTTYGYHSNTSPSNTRSGISANIDINAGGFAVCNDGLHSVSNGAVAWVEIKPRDYAAGDGSDHSTLRLGITECDSGTNPIVNVCADEGHPHFFYAKAGCNGYVSYPQSYIDLGVADEAPHDYAIYDTGSGFWYFLIDGNLVVNLPETDTRVSCWLDENLGVWWGSYRMDRGDSTGSAGGAELKFHDARYGRPGLGWFNPSWTSGSCQHPEYTDETCTLFNSDDLNFYQSS